MLNKQRVLLQSGVMGSSKLPRMHPAKNLVENGLPQWIVISDVQAHRSYCMSTIYIYIYIHTYMYM